jgi:hypothetical protein
MNIVVHISLDAESIPWSSFHEFGGSRARYRIIDGIDCAIPGRNLASLLVDVVMRESQLVSGSETKDPFFS